MKDTSSRFVSLQTNRDSFEIAPTLRSCSPGAPVRSTRPRPGVLQGLTAPFTKREAGQVPLLLLLEETSENGTGKEHRESLATICEQQIHQQSVGRVKKSTCLHRVSLSVPVCSTSGPVLVQCSHVGGLLKKVYSCVDVRAQR